MCWLRSGLAIAFALVAGTVSATPTIKSQGATPAVCAGTTNGSDVTLTFTNIAANDVTILIGGHADTSDNTPYGPNTAGYALLDESNLAAPDGGIWYKRQGGSPDANVVGEGGANAAHGVAYCAIVLDGSTVHASIIDTGAGGGSFAGVVPNATSVTTTNSNALIIAIAFGIAVDTSIGTVAGYTALNGAGTSGNDTDDITIGVVSKAIPVAGTTDDPAAWSAWSATNGFHRSFSIRDVGAATASPCRRSLMGVGCDDIDDIQSPLKAKEIEWVRLFRHY